MELFRENLGFSFYLSLFCWIHLWMLALFLIIKKQRSLSNLILAVFLGCFSFIHIQHVLLQTGGLRWMPFLDPVLGILLSAIGPLFYFYVRTLTGKPLTKSSRWHLLILAPAILHFVFLLITKNGADLKDYYYYNNQAKVGYTPVNVLLLAGMTVYFMAYMLACIKELTYYARSIRESYSNIEQIRLDWLRYIIILLIAFSFILAPLTLYLADANTSQLTLGYFSTFAYFIIVYKSLNSSLIFVPDLSPAGPDKSLPAKRYINSTISNEVITAHGQNIEIFLITNDLLFDENLSLSQLAEVLNIAPHILSEVINRYFQKSFFDLINSARIDEAKKQLQRIEKLNITIEGISYNCGFGSKAAFYRAFKKCAGITPTEYLKQMPHQASQTID